MEALEGRQLLSGCAPAVATDYAEYVRGETALISGGCFQAGERVTLQVVHTDGTTGGAGHEPWTVTADATGAFQTSWYVNPDDSAHEQFTLTAQGNLGSSATTAFIDPFLSFSSPTVRTPTNVSIGVSSLAAISGRAFYDANGNGIV